MTQTLIELFTDVNQVNDILTTSLDRLWNDRRVYNQARRMAVLRHMVTIRFVPKESFPLRVPVRAPVNGAGTGIDYEKAVYSAAVKRGYTNWYKDGWIATMGDESHNPLRMLEEFNDAVAEADQAGMTWIAALWQNSNFSVAWEIFTKPPHGKPI